MKVYKTPHKYAHNRRFYELKTPLYNPLVRHFDKAKAEEVVDVAEQLPQKVSELIQKLPLTESSRKRHQAYVE